MSDQPATVAPASRPVPVEQALGPLNEFEKKHAPQALYLLGDVTLLEHRLPRVSIVGSRKASREGLARAAKLARALVGEEIVVVSGLADGIDTAAHRAAMEAAGRTIAVIGTSLDQSYPRSNAALQTEIARNHLVVSQFPSGYPTTKANFPLRNRTMALIVDASVIVEAGDSSGTLSQGWEALRLGRSLFIMRSVLENPKLTWPAEMMAYGAQVLEDAQQVIEAVPTAGDLASSVL